MRVFSVGFTCYLPVVQHHEGAQDDEESTIDTGSHLADLSEVCSQDPGHQEGRRLPLRILFELTCAPLQAIDTLLEKEYIERVEGTRDTFAYVA